MVGKFLIRRLIVGGLGICVKDRVFLSANPKKRRNAAEDPDPFASVLTPMHILRGIVSRAEGLDTRTGGIDRAIYELLTRLGVPKELQNRVENKPSPDNSRVLIKLEAS